MKLDLSKCIRWGHHRSGWGCCIDAMRPLHSPYGVLVVDYLEKVMKEKTEIADAWVGFVHNTPSHPSIISALYGSYHNFDLNKMVQDPLWAKNIRRCLGLYCLSQSNARFIKDWIDAPVEVVYHATEIPALSFNYPAFLSNPNKKVVMIGHWMRNFQAIYELRTKHNKFILRGVGEAFRYDRIPLAFSVNDTVRYLERLADADYDRLLSENIVFLNLYDCSANNTVIECIARGTPVLVNRLPALEEYLGPDYPFFYQDLDEASSMLDDYTRIQQAHLHLLSRVGTIRPETFLNSVRSSAIYRSLPCISL